MPNRHHGAAGGDTSPGGSAVSAARTGALTRAAGWPYILARYATFGFSDVASLDEGAMWATAFALTELTAADEARIAALVKKATG